MILNTLPGTLDHAPLIFSLVYEHPSEKHIPGQQHFFFFLKRGATKHCSL